MSTDDLTFSKFTSLDGHTTWYIDDFGPFKSGEEAQLWIQLQAERIKNSKPLEERENES